jgi:hypothetical protein
MAILHNDGGPRKHFGGGRIGRDAQPINIGFGGLLLKKGSNERRKERWLEDIVHEGRSSSRISFRARPAYFRMGFRNDESTWLGS